MENDRGRPGEEGFKKFKEDSEIKMPEIAELSEPAKNILFDLRENIDKGEYAAILGDDASGRLPAWLFHGILSDIYKEKNFDHPKIIFFAGQIIYDPKLEEKVKQDFTDFIEKTKVPKMAKNKKVLFVTDTICSGEHLLLFAKTLKEKGINFDIATIGIAGLGVVKELEKKLGGKIFWGQDRVPAIYTRHDLSGVQERSDHSLFAKLFPPKGQLSPAQEEEMAQKRFEARKDVEILAKKLLEWYRKESI